MTPRQLTIDGREEAHPPRVVGLTERQREVLRFVRAHDDVRPIEVGTIIHAGRERPCPEPVLRPESQRRRPGCCQWASSDGAAALKRLAARGLVERVARGRWRVVAHDEEWAGR